MSGVALDFRRRVAEAEAVAARQLHLDRDASVAHDAIIHGRPSTIHYPASTTTTTTTILHHTPSSPRADGGSNPGSSSASTSASAPPRFQIPLKSQKGREPHSREVVHAIRRRGQWGDAASGPQPSSSSPSSSPGAARWTPELAEAENTGLFFGVGSDGDGRPRGRSSSSAWDNAEPNVGSVVLETKPFLNANRSCRARGHRSRGEEGHHQSSYTSDADPSPPRWDAAAKAEGDDPSTAPFDGVDDAVNGDGDARTVCPHDVNNAMKGNAVSAASGHSPRSGGGRGSGSYGQTVTGIIASPSSATTPAARSPRVSFATTHAQVVPGEGIGLDSGPSTRPNIMTLDTRTRYLCWYHQQVHVHISSL